MDIYVNNITKTFRQKAVVKDVSFTVQKGRCTALIGPNGAGKTTLLKILAGLLKQDRGDISYHHIPEWKQYIGFLPQVPSFYGWMTAREFLIFMGKFSQMNKRHLQKRIEEVLVLTGMLEAAERRIQGFSGGMKQRLGLAQALLHEPKILLLDEPVSALDPVGRRDVMNLLFELKASTTIIYSTHVLHDAQEVSDDVLLMKDGEIIEKGTLESLLSYAKQSYTLRSVDAIPEELAQCGFIKDIRFIGKNTAEIRLRQANSKEELLRWCLDHHVDILSFQQDKQTLESMFLEVVK